jgi:hypothetical protein
MGTYTLIARPDGAGYDIGVVAANGARHTMLGFKTRAEAQAWIAVDQAADRAGGVISAPAYEAEGRGKAGSRIPRRQ